MVARVGAVFLPELCSRQCAQRWALELSSYAEEENKRAHSNALAVELGKIDAEGGVKTPAKAASARASSPQKRGPAPFQHLHFAWDQGEDEIE